MVIRIHVANGCHLEVNCRVIGEKKYLQSVSGGIEFAASLVGLSASGNVKYEHRQINDFGFTTIGPGYDLEFTSSAKDAYITIETEDKVICNNEEVNEHTGYIIDESQGLVKAKSIDKNKRWVDEYGKIYKPKNKFKANEASTTTREPTHTVDNFIKSTTSRSTDFTKPKEQLKVETNIKEPVKTNAKTSLAIQKEMLASSSEDADTNSVIPTASWYDVHLSDGSQDHHQDCSICRAVRACNHIVGAPLGYFPTLYFPDSNT